MGAHRSISNQRSSIAAMTRTGRQALGWSQATLAAKTGMSRSTIADIEHGRLDPTLGQATAIATGLGYEIEISFRTPTIIGDRRQKDLVHARCSAYVQRRLVNAGWVVEREVAFEDRRWRGWIDLLAFDPRTRTLLVIEVKTRLDDIGALERQASWYTGVAHRLARKRGWIVRRIETWVLVLASAEVDTVLVTNREVVAHAFPGRAADLAPTIDGHPTASAPVRGIAAIDPRRRRRVWVLPTKVDGRRTPAPYRGYADAAHALSVHTAARPPTPR